MRVLSADIANVFDPKTKKFSKSEIKSVEESEASRHFARRNIIVKGTIIDTAAGKAKAAIAQVTPQFIDIGLREIAIKKFCDDLVIWTKRCSGSQFSGLQLQQF